VFHSSDHDIPGSLSKSVGKFRDLFYQIVRKAKDLDLF
jgi:hypothetical protein